MSAPLPAFQQFQMDFGRRCRNPLASCPAGVPARNMAVYEELLFNNITGFLDACFPLGRQLLGDTRWRRLHRAFFRDWRCTTPFFREIPGEFLRYLAAAKHPLPAWFLDLADYELAELACDTNPVSFPSDVAPGDLMRGRPVLNPTLLNLAYRWPVHRISAQYRPRRPVATQLLVFRDAADVVRFVEINALTASLLERLAGQVTSGDEAVAQLVAESGAASAAAIRQYAPAILDDLFRQGVILGVQA